MHERLLAAVGNRTYRHLGELTGTHPETVRRYLSGQAPSVEFVASLSRALNISAEWLLTGTGPMRCEEVRAHALAQADAGELLAAITGKMEGLIDRVDRIEVYMQSLETRVRAQQGVAVEHMGIPDSLGASLGGSRGSGMIEKKPVGRGMRATPLPGSDGHITTGVRARPRDCDPAAPETGGEHEPAADRIDTQARTSDTRAQRPPPADD